MKAYCLFEQSGTFKNEFRKLGIEAYDYDILNDYEQTDFQIDLYEEINMAYEDKPSIFDRMNHEDIVMAFFPCTRFECQIQLGFRGKMSQMKKWDIIKKMEYSMKLHKELHQNYLLLSKMVVVAQKKGLRMVIENPFTQPHYLTLYWSLDPTIIDKDRTRNGDYMKKPTQYFFVGFEPENNLIMEPLEDAQVRNCERMAEHCSGGGEERKAEVEIRNTSTICK